MFVDRVKIHVKGGNGGNGMVSFFRAKYITHGGPDGGDGGRGGDVIFVGDESMGTLMDFRYKRMFKAGNGQDGGKRNCFGKDGESVVIKVPVGTVIREAESGKIMAVKAARAISTSQHPPDRHPVMRNQAEWQKNTMSFWN